jgi:hypothetical protein
MSKATKQKSYRAGRICESADCTTRLSIYNMDELCSGCSQKVDIEKLPTRNFAKFIGL